MNGLRIPLLDPVYEAFAWLLAFFYGAWPHNLGMAIILVTFVIMAALFPLTAKSARSMFEMQRVQPELKKLQAKYKGDRQKLNEETMKFFQEHKINPLAGCLPLVVQAPIFIALFEVFRRAYLYVPESSLLYSDLCGNLSRGACGDTEGFPQHLEFLSMDLSLSALAEHGSLLAALPFYILVLLVVLTGILQSRQTRRNSPNMNPQMAMITKVMPVLFGVISINFPAGLVLYFFVSNLWRVGQQEVILRRYAAIRTKGPVNVKGAATDGEAGGGSLMGRLRALAESQPEPEPHTEEAAEPQPEEPAEPPRPRPKRGGSRNRKRKR